MEMIVNSTLLGFFFLKIGGSPVFEFNCRTDYIKTRLPLSISLFPVFPLPLLSIPMGFLLLPMGKCKRIDSTSW